MKQALIAQIAEQIKSYGYKVYIAKDGRYGFYTDGVRVVSFGGQWNFSVDFSGNYQSRKCGTGWQQATELTAIDAEAAEKFIKASAPQWATKGEVVTYTTPEQHLSMYGSSSGYTEV